MLKHSTLCFLLFCAGGLCAQDKLQLSIQKDSLVLIPVLKENTAGNKQTSKKLPEGQVNALANTLLDSIAEANKNLKYTQGYRILVYSGNDKSASLKVKERLYELIKDVTIYAIYKQPTYRIKIGDYTDRLEAHRVLTTYLKSEFPTAFIVPETVNIRRK